MQIGQVQETGTEKRYKKSAPQSAFAFCLLEYQAFPFSFFIDHQNTKAFISG